MNTTKRIKLALLGLLTFCSATMADSAKLAWNANTELDLVGYVIYWGEAPGDYSDFQNVGNVLETQINTLEAGHTYFFAVSARNAVGQESAKSPEVSCTLALNPSVQVSYPTVTPTQATLLGSVTGVGGTYRCWFEVCEGPSFVAALAVKTAVQTKTAPGDVSAVFPATHVNYTFRLVVDTEAVIYVSPARPFHPVPLAPSGLRFVPRVVEVPTAGLSVQKSDSIMIPEWREIFYAILDPALLEGPEGMFRARIDRDQFGL